MGQSVYVARRVMPDDNSCLFTAVAYVMEGYRSKGPELRCASELLALLVNPVHSCLYAGQPTASTL